MAGWFGWTSCPQLRRVTLGNLCAFCDGGRYSSADLFSVRPSVCVSDTSLRKILEFISGAMLP
jgi:hypothetical protein